MTLKHPRPESPYIRGSEWHWGSHLGKRISHQIENVLTVKYREPQPEVSYNDCSPLPAVNNMLSWLGFIENKPYSRVVSLKKVGTSS